VPSGARFGSCSASRLSAAQVISGLRTGAHGPRRRARERWTPWPSHSVDERGRQGSFLQGYGFSHSADFASLSTASRGAKKHVSPQLQQTTTSNFARWNTPLAPGSKSGPKWPTASVVVTRRSLLPQFEHGATCTSPPEADPLDGPVTASSHPYECITCCQHQPQLGCGPKHLYVTGPLRLNRRWA
jgi:hypothetical protein